MTPLPASRLNLKVPSNRVNPNPPRDAKRVGHLVLKRSKFFCTQIFILFCSLLKKVSRNNLKDQSYKVKFSIFNNFSRKT